METILNSNFCDLTFDEMQEVDGGGIVEKALDGVVKIYDSWCDMWNRVGQNIYYATH